MAKVSDSKNIVTMYKGFVPIHNQDCMIAVKGDSVATSYYHGDEDSWLTQEGFGRFSEWGSGYTREYTEKLLSMIPEFEFVWEAEEQP